MIDLCSNYDMQEMVYEAVKECCDEVRVLHGREVVALIRGKDSTLSPLALVTHTDRPRFICTSSPCDEVVSLAYVGSASPDVYAGCAAITEEGVSGFLQRSGDELILFVGDGCEDYVSVGDAVVLNESRGYLRNGAMLSPYESVDNLVTVMMETAKLLWESRPACDVYLIFTVDGQYDFKQYYGAVKQTGAKWAACVGAAEGTEQGEDGVVYARLCDRSFSSDSELSELLVDMGARPLVLGEGSCAASKIQQNGIPAAQLDVPIRFKNTLRECARRVDVEKASEVLAGFCQGFHIERSNGCSR